MIEKQYEKKVLQVLGTYQKFLRPGRIAQLSQVPIPYVLKILGKFERLRYVIASPSRRYKHPAKLIKEFLTTGSHPNIYEVAEKEYKITGKGLLLFNDL